MSKVEININKYLSEEDKKSLATDVFKDYIKESLFGGKSEVVTDSEIQRIIGNISHNIVMREVQKHIPDFEHLIKSKVRKVITKDDLSYQVFKRRSAWESKESKAITYLNEVIEEQKEVFQSRIKEAISMYDFTDTILKEVSNHVTNMSESLYDLALLIGSKDK